MRRTGLVMAVGLILVLAGCGGTARGEPSTVVVSAAASLTDVFKRIESVFESANPGVDVVLNFGGSSSLREQILEGAPIDIFASADATNMERVAAAGEVEGAPVIFARNTMQIAVPAGNPGDVTGLADLADETLSIGLCAAEVPCGELARRVLARAGVSPAIDTNEPDVRALLTKIETGELDAGITYVTDVISAGSSVTGIDIPEEVNVVAEYPIAVLANAPQPGAARALVDFIFSDAGRAIITDHGFSAP